jgi:hypothetical protein
MKKILRVRFQQFERIFIIQQIIGFDYLLRHIPYSKTNLVQIASVESTISEPDLGMDTLPTQSGTLNLIYGTSVPNNLATGSLSSGKLLTQTEDSQNFRAVTE